MSEDTVEAAEAPESDTQLAFCCYCQQMLPLSAFRRNSRRKLGVHSYCRKCASARERERYRRTRAAFRAEAEAEADAEAEPEETLPVDLRRVQAAALLREAGAREIPIGRACPGRAPVGGRRYCYEGCPDWERVQERLDCPAHLRACGFCGQKSRCPCAAWSERSAMWDAGLVRFLDMAKKLGPLRGTPRRGADG